MIGDLAQKKSRILHEEKGDVSLLPVPGKLEDSSL
jgi:hypothetical protein